MKPLHGILVTALALGFASCSTGVVGSGHPGSSDTSPPAPASLAAVPGDRQVALTWTASPGATRYNVKRATTAGGPYALAGTPSAASYSDAGLTNGTTYHYVVSAANAAGESANSAEVSAAPIAATSPPAAPTGLVATPGDTRVSLSWTASARATSYSIKRGTSSGACDTTAGTTANTSFTDTGRANGTPYYYVVVATNSAGVSGNSNEASATPVADTSELQLTVEASRTSGVAPLSVFFDATGSPSFSDGSYVDATFLWDFDFDDTDPNGRHKRASGFVAAHVFDGPGTHHVQLRVTNAQGRVGVVHLTIEAQAFSGTTYYVAATGSDSNDGKSMDKPVLTVAHAVQDLAGPNTRILFRKGDTFNTRYVSASKPGPVILASYEDPSSPSSAAPIIFSTAVENDWGVLDIGEDWRMMDLHVRSGGDTAGSAGAGGGPRYPGGPSFIANHGLIYRVEQDNFNFGWMAPGNRYNTVADCNIHHVTGTAYVEGGLGGAVIGNWVHDKTADNLQHVFRLQGGSRYFIAFNEFGPDIHVNYDSVTVRGNTDRVVIYHNIMHDWSTGIWPQGRNSAEEYQHHCVVEGNLFLGSVYRQTAIDLHSKDIVIRNNIFYNYENGIQVADDTVVGPSDRVHIYNNTFINPTAGGSFHPISLNPACNDVDLRNNVMLDAVGSTGTSAGFISYTDIPTVNGISDRNLFFGPSWNTASLHLFVLDTLAEWQAATGHDANSVIADPVIAITDGTNAAARVSGTLARPAAGSPAVDSGAVLPGVTLDFYGNPRGIAPDRGAVEVGAAGAAIPWE